MPRRSSNTYSLVRKRIRPSFKKVNVYNAATWNKNANRNTQYRQVFFAKQETRSYHGEHLTETQFRNIFKPENTSVSPLQQRRNSDEREVPHAMQTFTALERRLDFAVFRSLFASSVRQAAQFIVGGAVKVNGVKISSPSYQLTAGDVFSVDPNRVLEALGRSKPSVQESVDMTNRIIRKYNRHLDKCRANPEKMWNKREAMRSRHRVHNERHSAAKQRRADAHNATIKSEMNQKFMSLKFEPVLRSILVGDFRSEVEAIKGKQQQVLGLVASEVSASSSGGTKTTAEEDVGADQHPEDPLPENEKASKKNNPPTGSEEAVGADQHPEDPLPESKKASKVSSASKHHVAHPQYETISEQDLDGDRSPVDPLPDNEKASRRNAPETASEADIDADNSPVDPLPDNEKASRVNASKHHVANPQSQTISEQDIDGEKSPLDPLPDNEKASRRNSPETAAEQDVDADKSPVDPLPDSEKASRVNAAAEGPYNAAEADVIVAKYTEGRTPSRPNVVRLVEEIIRDARLEIREKYQEKLIDASAPAPFDPSWVERLPEKAQEVAADMSEEQLADLKVALPWSTTGKLYGLADPTKRWFTPWTPRQFIAPMAVLPHHIEVDFETCHAVYLRDPVARPNHSEVISPFSLEMHERAHMWYFYRRRKNLTRL